jgi:hypothetical protein
MNTRTVSESTFKAFEKSNHCKQALLQAEKDIESSHNLGQFDNGDPNHPMYNNNYNYATGEYKLFGYEQEDFMSKQYK